MTTTLTRIDAAGRLNISSQQRRALGLEPGGQVVVTLVGDELRVRSVGAAMAELQAEAAEILGGEDSSVDAFLAERRAQAAREVGEGATAAMAPAAGEREDDVSGE